jgi:hypothetical protein
MGVLGSIVVRCGPAGGFEEGCVQDGQPIIVIATVAALQIIATRWDVITRYQCGLKKR